VVLDQAVEDPADQLLAPSLRFRQARFCQPATATASARPITLAQLDRLDPRERRDIRVFPAFQARTVFPDNRPRTSTMPHSRDASIAPTAHRDIQERLASPECVECVDPRALPVIPVAMDCPAALASKAHQERTAMTDMLAHLARRELMPTDLSHVADLAAHPASQDPKAHKARLDTEEHPAQQVPPVSQAHLVSKDRLEAMAMPETRDQQDSTARTPSTVSAQGATVKREARAAREGTLHPARHQAEVVERAVAIEDAESKSMHKPKIEMIDYAIEPRYLLNAIDSLLYWGG